MTFHNYANPHADVGTGSIREVFCKDAAKPRTSRGRAAALSMVPQDKPSPYPELESLARAVIHRACIDAEPRLKYPGRMGILPARRRLDADGLRLQYDALRFLTDHSGDLGWWCYLCGVRPQSMWHRYAPLRVKFEQKHPQYAPAPVNSTAPNRAA